MDCGQPITHLDVAVFEDRTDFDRELLAAGVTLVRADAIGLTLERPDLIDHATMRANPTIRPKPSSTKA